MHELLILPLYEPTIISVDNFGTFKIWDALTSEILWEDDYFQISSGHNSQTRTDSSFALSNDRQFVAIGSIERLEIRRVRDGGLVTNLWPPNTPLASSRFSKITFSPDDRYLAAYDEASETVSLFDSENGKKIKGFKRKNASPSSIRFTNGMGKLMLIGQSGVDIWDILSGKLVRSISAQEITGEKHLGTDIDVSPDNRWLAAMFKKNIMSDNLILIYDLETYQPIKEINAVGGCAKIEFNPEQTHIIGLCGMRLITWDINSGEKAAESESLPISYWRMFPYEANVGFSEDQNMFVALMDTGDSIGVFKIHHQ
jgi:WD40 repeat protein